MQPILVPVGTPRTLGLVVCNSIKLKCPLKTLSSTENGRITQWLNQLAKLATDFYGQCLSPANVLLDYHWSLLGWFSITVHRIYYETTIVNSSICKSLFPHSTKNVLQYCSMLLFILQFRVGMTPILSDIIKILLHMPVWRVA